MLRNYANLNTVIATFWYRECQLLESYDEVLTQLGVMAERDAMPAACQRVLGR